MTTGSLSVVIPAYNEEALIERTLRETAAMLDEVGYPWEIVVVDDGSRDKTAEKVEQAAAGRPIRLVVHERNRGKGAALITGLRATSGTLVVFADADLEVHPRQITRLLDTMERTGADVVTGSKLHPDSEVKYPRRRRLLSFGYYVLVRALFNLDVHDTQTGLKLFRADAIRHAIPRLRVRRFASDLEILLEVHRAGGTIVEAPVVVTQERPQRRIRIRDVVRVLSDTIAVWSWMRLIDDSDRNTERTWARLPGPRTDRTRRRAAGSLTGAIMVTACALTLMMAVFVAFVLAPLATIGVFLGGYLMLRGVRPARGRTTGELTGRSIGDTAEPSS
jgi:dolichol-phosphate mannosyltransferase